MQNGELIANRYELEHELGEGGMATVWLARDRTLERPVAIKFLEVGDARERERMTEQFLREARIAAAVRHRNVIQILDFGVHEGTPFMAMEALSGESMADRFNGGPEFGLREVVEIVARCLEGLAAVHEAGIVHRDLKPENIFLVREPTGVYPKLLDFGISKTVDKRDGRRSAIPTEAGRVIGTPEYMSPEQARGLTDLDPRTDLYGIGVVMYEALTGRLPYDSPHMGDVLIKVVAGGAPPVAQVVPAVGWPVSDVVAKAMHRDRAERFASAMQMRAALIEAAQPLLTGHADPISLPPVRTRGQRSLEAQLRTSDAPLPDELGRAAAMLSGEEAGKPRLSPRVLIASAAGAAVLIAAGGFALATFRAPADLGAEPRYIVVQGAPAESAPAAPAASAPPALAVTAQPVAELAAPAATAGSKPTDRRKARPEPAGRTPSTQPAQALAQAFQRQKAPVVQCLNQHAEHVTDRAQMSVRLGLDIAGVVQSVDVMPAPIAATSLGSCIAGAVRGMRFGAQPSPISIRVPLTARRSDLAKP